MKQYIVFILFTILLASCSSQTSSKVDVPKANQWYTVSSFVDGDTFHIQNGDKTNTVKLLSLEVPEIKNTPDDLKHLGLQAALFTRTQLENSKEVKLTFDKQAVNALGQLEAIVELRDGRILNELLLEEGLATVVINEPNVKMENIYKGIEQTAKQNQNGIWRSGTEAGNVEIPVKKADELGIRIWVDKEDELVVITNISQNSIELDGWKLVSVKDNQTFVFHDYALEANSSVQIASGKNAVNKKSSPNTLIWEADNIWHLNEKDPAELYTDKNELVAVWEDN